jgi:hypothetical protein
MSDSNKDDWAMTQLGRTPAKKDEFLPEEDVFARNAPPPKNDDWAMTRINSSKNDDERYDGFDKTPSSFSPPQNDDWGKTQINPQKPQANIGNNDWDKTQANIAIPQNIIPKSNASNQGDDWGMTQANIQIPQQTSQNSPVNLDNTMYGFTPPAVSPKVQNQTYTPEVTPQKIAESASTNDATKWTYFLAGAFSMFVFMLIFLGIIYLLFLFN